MPPPPSSRLPAERVKGRKEGGTLLTSLAAAAAMQGGPTVKHSRGEKEVKAFSTMSFEWPRFEANFQRIVTVQRLRKRK